MAFFGLFVADRDVSRNKERTHISERCLHEKYLKEKAKRKQSHNWFQSFLKEQSYFYALAFLQELVSIVGVIAI